MLKINTSDSFPGAGYVAADPVSEEECCLLGSVAAIAAAANGAGIPYTIRMGKIFVDISDAGKLDMCLGVPPDITAIELEPLPAGTPTEITLTGGGVAEGEMWLTNNADWAAAGVKVKQGINWWTATLVTIVPAPDGLPLDPDPVWLWAINGCGRREVVGFQTTITTP